MLPTYRQVAFVDTRTALLNSAERASRAFGYTGFSFADMAKEVGIRKASIYHYFTSKADLAHALIARYRSRFAEQLESIVGKHNRAGERLQAYIDVYRAALGGGAMVCLCVAFSVGRDSLTPPVLEELAAFEDDSKSWLAPVFRLGREDSSIASIAEPASEAAACMALVEGAQLQARSAKDPSRFDTAVSLLWQRIQ